MTYVPKVNDYVIWTRNVEGWVYFKDSEYVTIEVLVKPKNQINYNASPIHANDRLLVLCYQNQWHELNYVRSRTSTQENLDI
jgi:hypothetical protein